MTRRRVVGVAGVVLLALFFGVKLVSPRRDAGLKSGFFDAPFGPFAGYSWLGDVHSVSASFTVPRIASGSNPGLAATWIGTQGQGPPRRFVQIGVIEGWSRGSHGPAYATFWSDTAHHYEPQFLFPVLADDTLAASLTRTHKRWTLAITDRSSGRKARFPIAGETYAPFNQAEWAQEDPGSENDHVIYPRLTAPVFRDLAVNSAMPLGTAVYSQWMSVNEGDFAPTPLHVDSFTLRQAPVATAAGAQYLRLAARAGAAFEQFETERSEWTPRTPYRQMVAASSRFTSATRGGVRSLEEARWPKRIRRLLRSFDEVAGTLVQRAVPPTDLTSSSLAAWNSRFTEAAERGAAVAAKLRLALGLPGAGPSYHR